MVSKHQYQLQSWLLWFQKLAPGPWCQPVSPSCFPTPLLPTSYSCSIQSLILLSFVFSPHPVNPNVPWIFGCTCHQCKQGMLGCIPHDGYHDAFAEIFEDRGVCQSTVFLVTHAVSHGTMTLGFQLCKVVGEDTIDRKGWRVTRPLGNVPETSCSYFS